MNNARITIPLEELERRIRAIVPTLPRIAGNQVVNFALDNFKRQGFLGASFQPWRPRKRNSWGKKDRSGNRAILIQKGRLRRSIRVVEANSTRAVIGSDVPYAKAHNEGSTAQVTQNVKEHPRKITTVGVVKKIHRKTRTNVRFGRVDTGNTTTVKAHTRKIRQRLPARPFLANSPYLNQQLNRTIAAVIMKTLKQ